MPLARRSRSQMCSRETSQSFLADNHVACLRNHVEHLHNELLELKLERLINQINDNGSGTARVVGSVQPVQDYAIHLSQSLPQIVSECKAITCQFRTTV